MSFKSIWTTDLNQCTAAGTEKTPEEEEDKREREGEKNSTNPAILTFNRYCTIHIYI